MESPHNESHENQQTVLTEEQKKALLEAKRKKLQENK